MIDQEKPEKDAVDGAAPEPTAPGPAAPEPVAPESAAPESTAPGPAAAEADVPPAAAGQAPEQSAEQRIERLESEIAELKDRALRALADAENTRRRAQREVADARKFGAGALAKALLNVSDNLRRAIESVPAELRTGDERAKNLVTGIEMVEKEFLAAFEAHGIKKIEPIGEPFNHDFHQAMYEVEGSNAPAGTVVELLQPGYVLNDRLLRPAMVAIAKGAPEAPPDDVERVDTTA